MTGANPTSRGQWLWLAAFGALLLAIAAGRIAAVSGRLPYGQHPDEPYLMGHAVGMLRTGDLNPHFFNYPSLPIYVTAISIRAATLMVPGAPPLADWAPPSRGGYYAPAFTYAVPRFLFALSSIAALAGIGWIAWSLFGDPLVALVAVLVLASSHVLQHSATFYLNVDVLTLFFAVCTLVVVMRRWEEDSYLSKAVIPGVLSGMAIACKYNSGLVLLSAGLAIVFASRRARLAKLLLLAACALGTFVVCVPYSVLDPHAFVRDVTSEIHHYRTGHRGFEGDAGLPQLVFYVQSLSSDLGAVTMWLVLPGLAYGLYRDAKRTIALAAFPLAMLAHMSTNRVHFLRTVLPVFALAPVFAAGGVAGIVELIHRAWRRVSAGGRLPEAARGPAARAALGLALACAYVWWTSTSALLDRDLPPDNRNAAVRWLAANAGGADVFVAPESVFAPDALAGLRAHATAGGMEDLDALMAEGPAAACYVAAPGYGGYGSDPINARISETLVARRAVVVWQGAGVPVPVSSRREPAVPTPDAALSLYRLTCGARGPT